MIDFKETQKQIWGSNDWRKISDKENYKNRQRAYIADWTPFVATEFPYYRPDLPSPLPTDEEILAARWSTKDNLTKDLPCRTVLRVRDYAVKWAFHPRLFQEAENMLYLEKHCPELKIPKVYAAFVRKEGPSQKAYLLFTEYIDGPSCYTHIWGRLSKKAKVNILRKLGDQLQLLRAVPPPNPHYYGRVYRQSFPAKDATQYMRRIDLGDEESYGPFDSHDDFTARIFSAGLSNACRYGRDDFNVDLKLYLEYYHDTMARAVGQQPVLTHTDLQIHNVIIKATENPDDPEIYIIDWEGMEWLPAYFQAARSLMKCSNNEPEYLYELHKGEKQGYWEVALFLAKFCNNSRISG